MREATSRNHSEFVREAITDIVHAQYRDNSPPQVRQTAERLIASGCTRAEAFTLLGCALSREMFEVLGSEQRFDEALYRMLAETANPIVGLMP